MNDRTSPVEDQEALAFHKDPVPGKLALSPTKPMATQRDLSLAYSPGVAAPVKAIAENPDAVYDYTSKGNMVAVISNGTAILGLGNLGAPASKPVMEGKAVLFKRFADLDAVDIEVEEEDAEAFIECVKRIGNTFGGINLEDIKARKASLSNSVCVSSSMCRFSMTTSTAPHHLRCRHHQCLPSDQPEDGRPACRCERRRRGRHRGAGTAQGHGREA